MYASSKKVNLATKRLNLLPKAPLYDMRNKCGEIAINSLHIMKEIIYNQRRKALYVLLHGTLLLIAV